MITSKAGVKPYTALSLQHFPTRTFYTDAVEIHPMWSGEGNLSYLVVNPKTREAVLIDPDLEILGSYLLTFDSHRLTLKAVIDTHTHAEHASAGPTLRQLTGADYLMNHRSRSSFVNDHLQDEDSRTIAGTEIKFFHTPGHTPDLQVIVIGNHLFTGDSLFINSCGRTDLPGGNSHQQFHSLERLMMFPDDTVVHPGHDYNNQLFSTIGQIRENNPRVKFQDPEAFSQFMTEFYITNEKPDDLEYYVAFNTR